MFISGENPVIKIAAVEHMRWEGGTFQVAPRSHAALAFRIRGTARLRTGDTVVDIEPGSVLYMPQNMAYRAEYADTELLAIHFITRDNDRHPEVYTPQDVGRVYDLFLGARALWRNKEPGYPVQVMSQLYAILGTISESQAKSDLPPHFLRAVSDINEHYRSKLNVDDVCRRAGIGTTVFRRLFKKHYRMSPVEYITELRLEHARKRIAGGMSVEEAAQDSGFADAKYFARLVSKHYGCTPRQLRLYGK